MSSKEIRNFLLNKEHHAYRKTLNWSLAEEFMKAGLSPEERMRERFKRLCREEYVYRV